MARYFMEIAYDGSNYHGWQTQPNDITVQETIETGLTRLLRENIKVTGCGRTDTGVHALSYHLHFDVTKPIASPGNFRNRFNSYLPHDIAVLDLYPVHCEAHARFDALRRTYDYYIHTMKDPFLHGRSLYYTRELDHDAMNTACEHIVQYTDFTSFSKLHTDTKTNNCTIQQAYWEQKGHQLVFRITADRFLRNMVRAIVGSIIPIGLGHNTPDNIKTIIEAKDRSKAGQSVPAHALYLVKTEYPLNLTAL